MIRFIKGLLILLILIIQSQAQDSLYLVNSLIGDTQNRLINAKATGDLNGDGYADLAVIFDDSTHIYFGNPNFELNTFFSVRLALSFPGDVNNDGFADFIFIKDNNIYLGFGGRQLDTTGILIYEPQYSDESFSGQVDPLGDVNGDGYNDFVIASPYNWSDGIGRVYLYFGGETINTDSIVIFTSDLTGDFFGHAATGIGDQNNDGYDDFLISAPNEIFVDSMISKVYLYHGSEGIDSLVDSILTFPDREFGFNLKNLGDINNDGTIDFAITSFDSCVIYLNIDSILTTQFYGSSNGIGGNGDIDNDEISDFILGYIKGDENDYSGMECYTGSPEIDLTPDYYANEEQEYSSFSKHSDFIGDFNNDGYDDIFVVAYTYRKDSKEIGKVYLYSVTKVNSIIELKTKHIKEFKLYPNHPNPFNSSTIIPFYLSMVTNIIIEIYDIQGKRIKSLFNGSKSPGLNTVSWDGKTENGIDAASGIYFYRLKTDNGFIWTKKLTLIR